MDVCVYLHVDIYICVCVCGSVQPILAELEKREIREARHRHQTSLEILEQVLSSRRKHESQAEDEEDVL
jgi:hypothetical protein